MRFVTYQAPDSKMARCGLIIEEHLVVDLEGACAAWLSRDMPMSRAYELAAALTPADASTFLSGTTVSAAAARQVQSFIEERRAQAALTGPHDEMIAFDLAALTLLAPVPRPGKFIATANNVPDAVAKRPSHPVGMARINSPIVGPDSVIFYPPETHLLDCGADVAIIIGKYARDLRPEEVAEHIFGYTIFNDFSAHDIYREEAQVGIPLLARNFPGFAVLGPMILTRDEISSARDLRVICRVNGELRQDSTLADVFFTIDEIVLHWSRIGLSPGDIVTAGAARSTLLGGAQGGLKSGDIVESEVTGLGVLKTTIGAVG